MDRGGSHDSESLFGTSLAQIFSAPGPRKVWSEEGGRGFENLSEALERLVLKSQRSSGAFWIP